MEILTKILLKHGEKLPKKHGEWRRIHVFKNTYLLLDSWNGQIMVHDGCESTGIDNMYRVIYVFKGYKHRVKEHMERFWISHLCHLKP